MYLHFRPEMNPSPFPFPPFLSLSVLVLFFSVSIPLCSSNTDSYTSCSTTQFVCGNITAGFPFWGNNRPEFCGNPGLELMCENDNPTININDVVYRVLEIDENGQSLRIARQDYTDGICQPQLLNTTLDPQLFEYASGYRNLTIIYGCTIPALLGVPALFNCLITGTGFQNGYVVYDAVGPGLCYRSIFVPVSETILASAMVNLSGLEESLKQGFQVKWKVDDTACTNCIGSKGVCGYYLLSNETTCYCPGQFIATKTCPSSPDVVPANPGLQMNLLVFATINPLQLHVLPGQVRVFLS
ncbi:LEAF RUST 10 DISEASE-RESISTANCE LOCUS RECEPTOR-LIKE PROTEIN KINASE-like 2.4 [Hevea brasiliensis]|uniref:LEAF RUST 10 DISEASE-RESISTANCE LOCUS RECEPTOR-LIKE PROTEIN KINASE-like 2.4 n=1 Tax=Hevea brasiliensis TaxID=3981 RepID=UPI0025D2DBC1|nr:LEAF RUST 10 DISEASE-RESISTANCE LOCUS RECEPTOR-LIKE PROTEIN KINASE-like 2.4 [Hevea brasiliensis]